MQLDTRHRHQIDENGALVLVQEILRQAVADAQRGDEEARQWLQAVAPDAAQRLAMGWRARRRQVAA